LPWTHGYARRNRRERGRSSAHRGQQGTCVGLSRNTKARRLGRTGVAADAVDIVWPFIEGLPIQRPENLETLAEGLRKAGLRA